MIIFLHGDNQVESRENLLLLKKQAREKSWEIIALDGNSTSLTDLLQSVETQSLFNNNKLVAIENLYSARKDNLKLLAYFKKNTSLDADIVLWEGKKIDGRKLLWLKKRKDAKIKEFNYPKVLFSFLESIGRASKEKTLDLFNKTIARQPVELVYFMIVRQIRLLLLVKTNSTNAKIKETQRLQSWQKRRLAQQSDSINLARLLKSYQKLMYIDYQQKTGQSSLDLKQTLDIFLTSL